MKTTIRVVIKIAVGIVIIALIAMMGVVIHAHFAIKNGEILAADSEAPGRFITVEGHRWHVAARGDVKGDPSGAPILLIHGFLVAGHATWLPWAEKLTAQRSLIMPDLLGYGHSERITTPGPHYTEESYVASLAAILDELGVQQVDLVGHSYGGVIAARFAVDHPARVRRLVLMSAPFYYLEPNSSENIIHLPLGVGRAVAWHIIGGGPVSFVTQYCSYRPNCNWDRHVHVKGTTDALRAAMRTHRDTANAAALLQEIPKITAPTLVVWGANDPFFPVNQGKQLAQAIKADLEIIPGAAHMPYYEQPDKVAQAVLDFLQPR